MSYQSGKMGIAEGIGLVFFVSFVPVFLSIFSITVDKAKGAAWMIPLINGPLVFSTFLGVLYAMKRVPDDLVEVSKQLLGNVGAWLISGFYLWSFWMEAVLLLREFAENTLLTAVPYMEFSYTILFYSVISVILLYLGIEPIARASYILTPFVLLGIVLVVGLVSPRFIGWHLLPWQGPGLASVVTSGIMVSGFNIGIFMIPIIARSFKNINTMRSAVVYGLSLSILSRMTIVLSYTLVFGVMVGREKVLPFFELTRLVYVSRYLQRIESLFILMWVICGIVAITVNLYIVLYILSRLFNLPTIRPIIIPVVLVSIQAAMLPPDLTTIIVFHGKLVTTVYNVGTFAIPGLLFIAALLKRRRRREWSSDS